MPRRHVKIGKRKMPIKFTLSADLGAPLEDGFEVTIRSEEEHAFFLRCCEVFRVIDLVDRTLDSMIETYSKYRTRDPFRETLTFRFFDSRQESPGDLDPELDTIVVCMFNLLHELRISLLHEDALPFTVKARLESFILKLKREWNEFQQKLERRYGWKFKVFVSEYQMAA